MGKDYLEGLFVGITLAVKSALEGSLGVLKAVALGNPSLAALAMGWEHSIKLLEQGVRSWRVSRAGRPSASTDSNGLPTLGNGCPSADPEQRTLSSTTPTRAALTTLEGETSPPLRFRGGDEESLDA